MKVETTNVYIIRNSATEIFLRLDSEIKAEHNMMITRNAKRKYVSRP